MAACIKSSRSYTVFKGSEKSNALSRDPPPCRPTMSFLNTVYLFVLSRVIPSPLFFVFLLFRGDDSFIVVLCFPSFSLSCSSGHISPAESQDSPSRAFIMTFQGRGMENDKSNIIRRRPNTRRIVTRISTRKKMVFLLLLRICSTLRVGRRHEKKKLLYGSVFYAELESGRRIKPMQKEQKNAEYGFPFLFFS